MRALEILIDQYFLKIHLELFEKKTGAFETFFRVILRRFSTKLFEFLFRKAIWCASFFFGLEFFGCYNPQNFPKLEQKMQKKIGNVLLFWVFWDHFDILFQSNSF